jgi:hypothetical protein
MASEEARVDSGRSVPLAGVAVACALAACYFFVVWWQTGWALERGGALEAEAASVVLELHIVTEGFSGEPSSAETLTASIDAVEERLDAMGSEPGIVSALPLPPGRAAQDRYEETLVAYVTSVDAYYEGLSMTASFVTARSAIVERFGEGLATLQELSAPDVSAEEVDAVLVRVERAVEEARRSLESLAAGPSVAYTSSDLLGRLEALSDAVAEIRSGLEESDPDSVATSVQDFADVLSSDWRSLFFVADEDGLQRFEVLSADIDAARGPISEARADLRSAQRTAGILALVLGLTAALVWRAARLQRSS